MKQSAGIMLFRRKDGKVEVLLAHPGGPYWATKDAGAWTVPKGEFDDDESPLEAAVREFYEETGKKISGKFIPLEPVIQKGRKIVYAYALEGDIDPGKIVSNTFEMEWPPRSGNMQSYPEIDKVEWFNSETAKKKINPAQKRFIGELIEKLLK